MTTVQDILNHTSEMFQVGKDLSLKRSSNYMKVDVRNSFYDKICGAINVYCIALSSSITGTVIEKAEFKNKCEPQYHEFFDILTQVTVVKEDFPNYLANIRQSLIISSWVAFESSITEIFKFLADDATVGDYEMKKFSKVKQRLIKKHNLAPEDLEQDNQLKKLLKEQHISIPDKVNFILNIFKDNYPSERDMESDKKFLDFFGFVRNTTHANSISFKERKFSTSIGEFSVGKDEAITDLNEEKLVALIKELGAVYTVIVNFLDQKEPIEDPLFVLTYVEIDE